MEPIVYDYEVRCDPGQAFAVYVGSDGQWWHPDYTPDAGTFERLTIGPDTVVLHHGELGEFVIGRVKEWDPPRRLVYSSTLAQSPEAPSEITVTFTPAGDGTRVHFEHGGWTEANASYRGKFGDWPRILERYVSLASRPAT